MTEVNQGQQERQEPTFEQPPFADTLALPAVPEGLPWHPNDIQAGLEWALENDDATAKVLSTIHNNDRWHESGNGVRFKKVSHIFTPHGLLIRRVQTTDDAEYLKKMIKAVSAEATRNVASRGAYDTSFSEINETSKENQHEINVKRGWRSLGGAALGGGALALENLAYIGSLPTSIVVGGAALGLLYEGGTWAAKTLQIQSRRRASVRSLANPPLREDSGVLWHKMSATCENLVAAYHPEDQEGDIEILEGCIVIDIDVTKAKLRKPGGPALEKYADVLDYLSSIADERHGKNTHQLFPISIVKEMLESTNGKIWSNEFQSTITTISKSQRLLLEKTEELEGRKKEKKKVTKGMQVAESIDILKTDVKNITGTIILSMLELLRINHEYNTLQDQTKEDSEPVIVDPFESNNFS